MEISLPLSLFFLLDIFGVSSSLAVVSVADARGQNTCFTAKAATQTLCVHRIQARGEKTKGPVFAQRGEEIEEGLDTTTAEPAAVGRLRVNSTPSCFNSARKRDNKTFLLSDSLAASESFSSIFWRHSLPLFAPFVVGGPEVRRQPRASLTC